MASSGTTLSSPVRRRGRDADPASYVATVAGARIGAADGMTVGIRPDEDGTLRVHPDDVRPFRNGGFILLENQEVS